VRRGLLAAALGVVILIGTGTLACRSRPPGDAGSAAASALASPSSAPPAASVPVADGGLPAPDADVPPVRLTIPAIRVAARVDPVAVDPATNDFAVPPSVDVVGWYRYGPGLSAPAGSVVIAGHVDGAAQGPGAFFRLRDLAIGAEIEVTGADGRVVRYTVAAREIYRKTAIPLDRYFARDGAPRLTLITCGGPFDRATGHYRDNVVITAAR
jgi:sortase family protein